MMLQEDLSAWEPGERHTSLSHGREVGDAIGLKIQLETKGPKGKPVCG